MTGLFLATADVDWRARIRDAYKGDITGEIRRAPDGLIEYDQEATLREIKEAQPRVVMIGPGLAENFALGLAKRLDNENPEICAVLVTLYDQSLFQNALRAGVRDILSPDASTEEISEVIDRALDTAVRRSSSFNAHSNFPVRKSRVIAVVSPKGGAGKTAIATNMGVGMAKQEPGSVVIIDLDVRFGDVGHALRLLPDRTLTDLGHLGADADTTTVKATLTPHPSGLFVLCAPNTPGDADDISNETIAGVIRILSQEFDYVILDTPAGLDETTLTAMELATDLILVCGTDVASTRSMRKEIEAFDIIGLTTQRRYFVLNRADARVGLEIRDIEGTVGMEVDVAIPSSRSVPLSMNQGSPILESAPRSPVARAYGELANLFLRGPLAAAPSEQAQTTEATITRFRRRKETR